MALINVLYYNNFRHIMKNIQFLKVMVPVGIMAVTQVLYYIVAF